MRERFNNITEAYSLLRKPEKRPQYNALYTHKTGYSFAPEAARHTEGMAAISDANMHAHIVMYLYKKRRECARHPGAGTYDIIRTIDCS